VNFEGGRRGRFFHAALKKEEGEKVGGEEKKGRVCLYGEGRGRLLFRNAVQKGGKKRKSNRKGGGQNFWITIGKKGFLSEGGRG